MCGGGICSKFCLENVLIDMQRRAEVVALAGLPVEVIRHDVELIFAVDRQFCPLTQVLAQQAICVLASASLPRALRVAEVQIKSACTASKGCWAISRPGRTSTPCAAAG